MKGDPEQRALLLGEYIVEHGATVRAAARGLRLQQVHRTQRTCRCGCGR